MEKYKKYVDSINDGDYETLQELIQYIGSLNKVLEFFEKVDVLQLLDPYGPSIDDKQNLILWYQINSKHSKETYENILSNLSDVEKKEDGYYVTLRDITDLSDLFQGSSRDFSPKDVVKSVLSEDYWEPFWDTTDNVYRDVIEELNDENLKYLKEIILKELEGVKLEINIQSSDEMELIASEQGHDDYLLVTQENIDRIVNDEDSMDSLMNNYLENMKSNLFNIHSNSYNDAYSNEYYKKVWNELGEFFENKTDWVKFGDKYHAHIKIKAPNQIIYDYLDSFIDYGYHRSIEYNGSIMSLIEELINEGFYEPLSFRIHDYPNSSEVDKNINLIFKDYI